MYTIEDLFDKRSVVGTKLEQIMFAEGCTKSELCKKAGVSRPTFDKLLAGTLTNKTNYEKHITKILDYLKITPDILLGNIKNACNRTREMKNIMKISSEEMSKATGISLSRLQAIEAGEEATLAELRDIAMCLSVGVSCLKGKMFFEPQICKLDHFFRVNKENDIEDYSGFWVHMGVMLNNSDEVFWFPITSGVRKMIYEALHNERIVVPCMNNRVLMLNMNHVKEIVLSDFDCDQPDFIDWSNHVDCGYLPLVLYEALEDYVLNDIDDVEVLSEKMQDCLKNLLEEKEWMYEDIHEKIELSNIYYSDGRVRPVFIDFMQEESISQEIGDVYLYEDSEFSEDVLFCEDIGGTEIIFNMKNIAMLELPLLKIENKICEQWEELFE